ncbi:MAG: hypothetical protein AAFR84_02975 [Pseudomonadota bacterium]
MTSRVIGAISFAALIMVASGLSTATPLLDPRNDPNGEAQEHVEDPQPDNPLPPPLRVQIIEGADEAAERAVREQDARDRDKAHLVASQSIDAATQSLNAATQRMVEYTWWSNLFVGVGTAVLIFNLWLLGRANKTANDAVAATWLIGRAQSRAYIGVKFPEKDVHLNLVHPHGFEIEYTLKNYGNSPAMNVAAVGAITIREFPLDDSKDFLSLLIPKIDLTSGWHLGSWIL